VCGRLYPTAINLIVGGFCLEDNEMGMPGFTADAAIGALNHRHLAPRRGSSAGEVMPQYFLPPHERVVCWWGNLWIDPTGYLHATLFCGGIAQRSF
jgi:hypothetical protein